MRIKSTILVLILVAMGNIAFSQSLGTIQNNTNPALPNSYNFREYVYAEPNDQVTCTGATNATAVIEDVFFAQTHRLSVQHPLFFLIGYRPALLQVGITGSGTSPDVKITGTFEGNPLGELCLAGPTALSSIIDLNIANFTDYFSVTLPKSWMRNGLELTITAGSATRTLTPAELKIGPYTELNLVQVDLDVLDYNGNDPHSNPVFDDFLQELASAIPASVVRHGVFPKVLKFPEYIASNGTEQLVRLSSKSEKAENGITSDGSINSVATLFTSKMHRSTNDYLSTIYYGNTLNLRPGGWGGGKSFVGFDFTDIFIHELGHALSLPHWGESAYGITNPTQDQYLYPYGGIPNYGAGRGSSWNFIQDLYEFEDPICRISTSDKNGQERSDAMQRGNKCLAERSDGLSPWDGFGDFSAFAMHNYFVGKSSPYAGQVYDIQTNGLKDFQIKRHSGFPNMTLNAGQRVYTRDPLQPQTTVYEERFTMPGQEQLNQDIYLIYGSAHATQTQANIVYEPVAFNGTLPPVVDPTNPTTFGLLKTLPYKDFLFGTRDITLKLYYDDGSVLHMLNPYHSYNRNIPTGLGIWRDDVCSFSLVAPRGTKKLRKVELYRRPFCVRGTADTTEGNINNTSQNITAANFMDSAVWQAEYVFDIFDINFISSTAVSCGSSDGTITYSFSDNPNQTTIEFSLDGGATYPISVADNSGSFTINNLGIGSYNIKIRSGVDFEMSLGEVIIGDCFFDCNGVENGTAYEDDCNLCIGGNTGVSGIIEGTPQGYTLLGNEGQTATLPGNSTVAYGANCSWSYKTNVSGTITINNTFFGGDPIPGIAKKAYYLQNGTTIDCNGVANGSAYLDSCNKCVGGNTFRTDCSTTPITDTVNFTFAEDVLGTNQSHNVTVNYSATTTRDIFVFLQDVASGNWEWEVEHLETVSAGSGSFTVSFTIPNLAASTDEYRWGTFITNEGGDYNGQLNQTYIDGVDIDPTLDTPEMDIKTKFIIYPNPTKDLLNIDLDKQNKNLVASIIDLSGRLILSNELNSTKNTLNLTLLTEGIYLLYIKDGEHLVNVQKIAISK